MPPTPAPSTLRVHMQITLTPDGVRPLCQVVCPRSGAHLGLGRCSSCPRFERIERRSGDTFVVCQAGEVAPTPELPASTGAAAVPVGALMGRDLLCVTPDVEVGVLARVLDDQHLSAMPVVDDLGAPLGIVTKTDIVRALRDRVIEVAPRVADIMTPLVIGVAEEASAARAAALMACEGVHHILVLSQDARLVGILSSLDLARWIAKDSGYVLSAPRGHDG